MDKRNAHNGEWTVDYSRVDRTIFARDGIRYLKILVVGAGALGNQVIQTLASLGVSEITVVDPDRVAAVNRAHSILFRIIPCLGMNKTEAIAAAAALVYPDTQVRAIAQPIADTGLAILARTNLLFSCVDSDLARLEISYLCTKLNLAWCDGGLGANNYSHGRVTWFGARNSACFSCMLPAQRRRELLTTWEPVVGHCTVPFDTPGLPSAPTTSAVVAALQVDIGLRNYLAQKSQSQTIEIDLTSDTRLSSFDLEPSNACPFHWNGERAARFHPLPPAQTKIGEWLTGLESSARTEPVLELDWPVCTNAWCAACHTTYFPMVRAATLRTMHCETCQRPLTACGSLRRIDQKSEWAARVFEDLRLPPDHLLTTRLVARNAE